MTEGSGKEVDNATTMETPLPNSDNTAVPLTSLTMNLNLPECASVNMKASRPSTTETWAYHERLNLTERKESYSFPSTFVEASWMSSTLRAATCDKVP